tara:strand:+ start:712 stop:900 length:189 start_codon:yes stop_codon:yes gene_type:complete
MNMSMFKPYRFEHDGGARYTLYSMPGGWVLIPEDSKLPVRRLTRAQADKALRESKYLGRGSA